jgi:o-succinylbenzoate synthase
MLKQLEILNDRHLQARFVSRPLVFNKPSGTSRGVLTEKPCWYLIVNDEQGNAGIGECGPIWGLSPEKPETYEKELKRVCELINDFPLLFEDESLNQYPSIRFGLETALLDVATGGRQQPYPSPFTEGADSMRINGLIWMGSRENMLAQINEKLKDGFRCLKLKIGAIDWSTEREILGGIREHYPQDQLELRVDANGAFNPNDALKKLSLLGELNIHSIEQPIQPGQWDAMAELCQFSPVPIALDEELIGIYGAAQVQLLDTIKPQYLILKPSLLGGIEACEKWIALAEARNIGWWVTSMLESNLGLNTIAQWTYTLNNPMPQGLGTGQLYKNNLPSPMYLNGEYIKYNPAEEWDLGVILG